MCRDSKARVHWADQAAGTLDRGVLVLRGLMLWSRRDMTAQVMRLAPASLAPEVSASAPHQRDA
jgi:hypothetical protein